MGGDYTERFLAIFFPITRQFSCVLHGADDVENRQENGDILLDDAVSYEQQRKSQKGVQGV